MTRICLALVLVTPLATACLDASNAPLAVVEDAAPRSPRSSLVDRVGNARHLAPDARATIDPRSALDLDLTHLTDAPAITVPDGWQDRGGGTIDELGGSQQWARTLGGAGWDSVQQVVRYDDDEVVVVGWVEGAVDFGGACGSVEIGMRTKDEAFLYSSYVARFDDNGTCQWLDTFDSDDAWPVAVAVDAARNVWVAGMFDTEVRFGAGFDLETTGNAYDVFVARYDSQGQVTFTRSITGPSDTWIYDLALVEDGNGADAVVVGSFNGTADVGGTSLTAVGGYDMLVARYTAAGGVSFASSYGGEGDDEAYAVATTAGGIVVGGAFGSAVLSVGAAGLLSNAGAIDAVLLGLSSSGAPVWANGFGGEGDDYAHDLAAAGDDVAVVGSFSGTMTVAGLSALTAVGTSLYVAKVGPSGAGVWSYAVSSANGVAFGTSVRANAAGDVYLAGVIDGDAAFGGTVLSPNAGSWSIVTARYHSSGGETPLWAAQRDGADSIANPVLDLTNTNLLLSADSTNNGGDVAFYGLGL